MGAMKRMRKLIATVPTHFPPRYKWKDGRWLSDAVNDYLHVPLVILSNFYDSMLYICLYSCPGFAFAFAFALVFVHFLIMSFLDVVYRCLSLSLFLSLLGSLSPPAFPSLMHGFSHSPFFSYINFYIFYFSKNF